MRSSASSWLRAEPSGRHEWRRRQRRRHADQRQRAAPAQERKRGTAIGLVAGQIIPPGFRKAMLGGANIGVVIAGDDGDAISRADALQPGPRRRKLGFQREIDEVAGDRDLIRRLRLHVRHQRIEHVAAVEFVAIAGPVEIAERAFAREIASRAAGSGGRCGSDRWASVNAVIASSGPAARYGYDPCTIIS